MNYTVKDFLNVFDGWASVFRDNKTYLIELDSIAGDGDLGLSMNDGFSAVREALHELDTDDIGVLFYTAGKVMSAKAPSSLGTLIASGFMQAGKAAKGVREMNFQRLAQCLEDLELGVTSRGKAALGEKTFLDGFHPAVQVLRDAGPATDFKAVLTNAARAAHDGSQGTIGMLGKHGRIAIRGEESRSILDPGSVVADLLISSLAKTLGAAG
jgi:Dihydroxyacetone kinase